MYRTRRVFIGRRHKRHGYCNELAYRTRALRNSANYIIRNVSSALYKKPVDRTSAEDAVLVKYGQGIYVPHRRKRESLRHRHQESG